MMNFICKMDGEPATWPCPSPGCPLFGDCLSECEGNSKPPMTNADRIRAMSDEELAKWMDNFFWGHKKANLFNLLDWLRQPVKED